jgi:hypothetical protein
MSSLERKKPIIIQEPKSKISWFMLITLLIWTPALLKADNSDKKAEINRTQDIILEKGEYYIGDLCYVIPELWSNVCKELGKKNAWGNSSSQPKVYELELNNNPTPTQNPKKIKMFIFFMGNGDDGTYNEITLNKSISCDSGTLGCIETKECTTENLKNAKELGLIKTFDKAQKIEILNKTSIKNSLKTDASEKLQTKIEYKTGIKTGIKIGDLFISSEVEE